MGRDAGSRGIAEIVGVLGVIASLVFVGAEIRQNTAAVRSATILHVSDQAMSLGLAIASDMPWFDFMPRRAREVA